MEKSTDFSVSVSFWEMGQIASFWPISGPAADSPKIINFLDLGPSFQHH